MRNTQVHGTAESRQEVQGIHPINILHVTINCTLSEEQWYETSCCSKAGFLATKLTLPVVLENHSNGLSKEHPKNYSNWLVLYFQDFFAPRKRFDILMSCSYGVPVQWPHHLQGRYGASCICRWPSHPAYHVLMPKNSSASRLALVCQTQLGIATFPRLVGKKQNKLQLRKCFCCKFTCSSEEPICWLERFLRINPLF